jgi:ATP-dependent Lhr-like helicase
MEKFKIDLSTADDMVDIIKKQSKTHSVPDNRCWLIENYEDFVIIHACNGSRVNDTIGRYLAAIISAKTGVATNVKIDPYRIILQTKAIAKDVYATLKDASNLKEVLELSVSRSSLFKHRFIHVARRFGILRRGAQLEKLSMNKLISQYEETPVWKETAREIMTDKMDIEKAESILTDVKNGKIKIVAQQGLSYIGELGLKHRFAEMIKPAQPDEEIFKAFKRRLLATRIRLVCMTCANYCITKEVRELEEEPECKNCNSRLIAIVKRTLDIVKIAKKKLKKRPLTPEELEIFRQTHRTADLTIVYGKKAAIALAGHGVGPETAARILSKLHTDEDALLKDILAAEKEFTKTRIYWK